MTAIASLQWPDGALAAWSSLTVTYLQYIPMYLHLKVSSSDGGSSSFLTAPSIFSFDDLQMKDIYRRRSSLLVLSTY